MRRVLLTTAGRVAAVPGSTVGAARRGHPRRALPCRTFQYCGWIPSWISVPANRDGVAHDCRRRIHGDDTRMLGDASGIGARSYPRSGPIETSHALSGDKPDLSFRRPSRGPREPIWRSLRIAFRAVDGSARQSPVAIDHGRSVVVGFWAVLNCRYSRQRRTAVPEGDNGG